MSQRCVLRRHSTSTLIWPHNRASRQRASQRTRAILCAEPPKYDAHPKRLHETPKGSLLLAHPAEFLLCQFPSILALAIFTLLLRLASSLSQFFPCYLPHPWTLPHTTLSSRHFIRHYSRLFSIRFLFFFFFSLFVPPNPTLTLFRSSTCTPSCSLTSPNSAPTFFLLLTFLLHVLLHLLFLLLASADSVLPSLCVQPLLLSGSFPSALFSPLSRVPP